VFILQLIYEQSHQLTVTVLDRLMTGINLNIRIGMVHELKLLVDYVMTCYAMICI